MKQIKHCWQRERESYEQNRNIANVARDRKHQEHKKTIWWTHVNTKRKAKHQEQKFKGEY